MVIDNLRSQIIDYHEPQDRIIVKINEYNMRSFQLCSDLDRDIYDDKEVLSVIEDQLNSEVNNLD